MSRFCGNIASPSLWRSLYGRVLDELIGSRERRRVVGSIRGDGVGGAPASRRVLHQDAALLHQILDISEGRVLRALGKLCPFRCESILAHKATSAVPLRVHLLLFLEMNTATAEFVGRARNVRIICDSTGAPCVPWRAPQATSSNRLQCEEVRVRSQFEPASHQ
jgi:hypothetical protein